MRNEALWNTANELFRSGQYMAAAAICTDALRKRKSTDWLLLRARVFIAMGESANAERDLRRCLELNPGSPDVRAMLADLARDRDAIRSGEHYTRTARRLDTETGHVKRLIKGLTRPTAAVEKLPAATAAVGWNSHAERAEADDRKLKRKTTRKMRRLAEGTTPEAKRPKYTRPKRFGEYLVVTGQLTGVQLRAALAYHRARGVRVGEAAVILGFLSSPKVEWAASSFHKRRPGDDKSSE
ncbi:MAG: tetratricopeptide repeat protein [Deltaproteobacteria bacterium]|nr:tetratricopeptide repeat protein [Deltaproteobacteria bacterium]